MSTAPEHAPVPAGDGGRKAGEPLAITEDGFLDNRLVIRQPRDGYRAAIDPLFLAAAVPAEAGERALDLGTGVGVAALALAHRIDGLKVSGIEVDPVLMRLAADNARANGFAGRTDFMVGDVARPPARLAPGTFDHVMANPPYLEAERAQASPDPGRAAANMEGRGGRGADLAAWLRFGLAMAKNGGTLTVIHRAERMLDILDRVSGLAGGAIVFPLWPDHNGAPAKRVIVQVIKGSKAPLTLTQGLTLHEEGGGFTAEAEAVLRGGMGLRL